MVSAFRAFLALALHGLASLTPEALPAPLVQPYPGGASLTPFEPGAGAGAADAGLLRFERASRKGHGPRRHHRGQGAGPETAFLPQARRTPALKGAGLDRSSGHASVPWFSLAQFAASSQGPPKSEGDLQAVLNKPAEEQAFGPATQFVHEKMVQPTKGWHVVVWSAVTAFFVIILVWTIGKCLVKSAKAVPTEVDKLEKELEETEAHLTSLRAAREVARMAELEQAKVVQAAMIAGDDVDPVMNMEAEAVVRARLFERSVEMSAEQAMQELGPALAKAHAVRDALHKEFNDAVARTNEIAQMEAENIFGRVKDVLVSDGAHSRIAEMSGYASLKETTEELTKNFRSFGLMLAGFLAPAQLNAMCNTAFGQIYFQGFLLATIIGCLIDSYDKTCDLLGVWAWCWGVVFLSTASITANALVTISSRTAMNAMAKAETSGHSAGNVILDFTQQLKGSSRALLHNLLLYEKCTQSWAYLFSIWCLSFYMVWGAIGVYIAIADFVNTAIDCKAQAIVAFLLIYSFAYVLFFTWSVIILGTFAVARSTSLRIPIMRIAMQLDDANAVQVPIFVTLVRALLLRSSADVFLIERLALQGEIDVLEAKQKEDAAALALHQAELSRLGREEQYYAESEEKLVEQYATSIDELLEKAEPLIHVSAALAGRVDVAGMTDMGQALIGVAAEKVQESVEKGEFLEQARAAKDMLKEKAAAAGITEEVLLDAKDTLQAKAADAGLTQEAFEEAKEKMQQAARERGLDDVQEKAKAMVQRAASEAGEAVAGQPSSASAASAVAGQPSSASAASASKASIGSQQSAVSRATPASLASSAGPRPSSSPRGSAAPDGGDSVL